MEAPGDMTAERQVWVRAAAGHCAIRRDRKRGDVASAFLPSTPKSEHRHHWITATRPDRRLATIAPDQDVSNPLRHTRGKPCWRFTEERDAWRERADSASVAEGLDHPANENRIYLDEMEDAALRARETATWSCAGCFVARRSHQLRS
jgi:hypothetical protein